MIATTVEPTTASAALAGDLVLVRLLPQLKRPPAPKRVRDEVGRFFRERPSDERWQETIDGLIDADLITTKPLLLTEAGRARAHDFLRVAELPPRCNWGTIQAKFLLPKALGLAAADQAMIKKIGKEDGLASLLLRRRFDLDGAAGGSLNAVVEALVCREIGFPGAATFKAVRAEVLSRLIGLGEPLDGKTLKKQAPRLLLGAKKGGLAGLREAALRAWADGAAPDAPEPAEFDLPAFARTVRAAARDCPTGRFGDNKVFIGHVWRRLTDEPGFPAMDLPTFKHRLTEANNAGMLTLSRADLVEVMDPKDVQEAETRYLNAEFHFVLLEKEQP